VNDSALLPRHRFTTGVMDDPAPDNGVLDAVGRVVEVLPDIRGLSCVWRTTPAGAPAGPVPQRLVLVETGPDGFAPSTSYRVEQALRRAGIRASVEVIQAGSEITDYHADALAVSRRVSLRLASGRSKDAGENGDGGSLFTDSPSPRPVTSTRRRYSAGAHAEKRSTVDAGTGGGRWSSRSSAGDESSADAEPDPVTPYEAGVRPIHPEPAHAEPTRTEPSRSESSRTDLARTDLTRTDLARTESVRSEPARSESSRVESRPESSRSESRSESAHAETTRMESRAESSRAESPRSDSVHGESARVEPARTDSVQSDPLRLDPPAVEPESAVTSGLAPSGNLLPDQADDLSSRELELLRQLHEELAKREGDSPEEPETNGWQSGHSGHWQGVGSQSLSELDHSGYRSTDFHSSDFQPGEFGGPSWHEADQTTVNGIPPYGSGSN
jgi:hypothetical protein